MKISVSETILSGNLFNETGYDEHQSAKNLAGLCENEYREILEREYPGAEIDVGVDVQYASGCGGELYVYVEDDDKDAKTWETEEHIKYLLDSNDIWQDRWDEWAVELTVDDLDSDDVSWDGDEFSFPEWLSSELLAEANEKYALLADYNRAYDLECTDLYDSGYKLYEKIRGMIDRGETPAFRMKKFGPYNPNDKFVILANAIQTTGQWHSQGPDVSHCWTPMKFQECEDTFDILKLFGITYPWKIRRENRIKNAAHEWTNKSAPELPGLKSALDDVTRKISELEREKNRLSARVTEETEKHNAAKINADKWVIEQLNK